MYMTKSMAFIFDMPADKTPPKAEREYLIPTDLKTKQLKQNK